MAYPASSRTNHFQLQHALSVSRSTIIRSQSQGSPQRKCNRKLSWQLTCRWRLGPWQWQCPGHARSVAGAEAIGSNSHVEIFFENLSGRQMRKVVGKRNASPGTSGKCLQRSDLQQQVATFHLRMEKVKDPPAHITNRCLDQV